ncbi:P-loop containing nucleoside triphosphate hydrolase protein [Peniophora sp. CONT]|nr:P-loop containing nucleoside triphosphate hydrolase protein [Peniophora sp. CONT]
MDLHVVVNAVAYEVPLEDGTPVIPLWKDMRMLPVYVAGISVVLALPSTIHGAWRRMLSHVRDTNARPSDALRKDLRAHIISLGGMTIYVFRLTRAICVFALLGLYAYDLVPVAGAHTRPEPVQKNKVLGLMLFLTYLYASCLALFNIVVQAKLARRAALHLVLILLASCTVYSFRNIWPLMTYTLRPLDAREGARLWIKIALLAFAGIVIPLTAPREYTPLNLENPSEEPNPEQTCSILSLLTYSYLDKPIYTAYRYPQLPSETLLPAIADYDRTAYLVNRSFKHLDVFSGARRQHVFFALMRVFRSEYITLSCLMALCACTSLFAPVGINRLLTYLETGGESATVQPWVWCLLIFSGPFISTILMQFYNYTTNTTLVRVEAMVTQLIFEHALRLRAKVETSASTSAPSASSPSNIPDRVSVAETGTDSTGGEGSESAASHSGETSPSTAVPSGTHSSDKSEGRSGGKEDSNGKEERDNSVGKINNLVTTDLQSIVIGRDFIMTIVYLPVTVAVSLYFLYRILGWSTFVGMAIMIACLPVPGYLVKKLQDVQRILMEKTDARVQSATEMMGVLRMIKMFGWEGKIAERLSAKRTEELHWLRSSVLIDLASDGVTLFMPVFQMVATYGTFTLVMGGRLTPSIVFPSMSVFMLLRTEIGMFFFYVSPLIKAKVSLDRVTEFLRETELLDEYAHVNDAQLAESQILGQPADDLTIGMCDASFTWSVASSSDDGIVTPSRRTFTLRVPGELTIPRGKINIIVGPTGSGKTSLLMALLGEMHFTPQAAGAWVNLPRAGGVAYAAQESWVQNETIRDNILFGAPYDEVRYKKVIHQCGLKRDLSLFEAGDRTEVGEKGLTLSGGQKARVTLARAIYSSADILLLDDVLAALDVHTAKWVVDKCLKGDLVRGRTVLLVTHNVALVGPISDYVVAFGSDGAIVARGSYKEVLAKDRELAQEAAQEEEILAKANEDIEEPENLNAPETKADGKLIVKEEIAEGHVSLHALKLFWTALGGKHPVAFWATFFGGIFGYHVLASSQSFWLGRWAEAYRRPDPVDVLYYLGVFVLLVFGTTVAFIIASATYVFGVLRAAKKIHALLIDSILGTTLRWLDQTPVSRVIIRCTKDIKSIDGPFAGEFRWLMNVSAQLITQLVAIAVITPAVIFPGAAIFLLGALLGRVYMNAQLPVKREMSNRKAPVLGHFGAAVTGLTSIRAYGAQDAFRQESYQRIENYTRSSRMFYDLNRWIAIRSDALAALFPSGLGVYMVYGPGATTIGASNVGFSLAMAASFSNMILYWVKVFNEIEVEGNSLERIQAYLEIEQEPKPVKEKTPPAAWPTSGDLRVEGLSARYSPDGPKVLHDLSFNVKSGERIGIVGRTGSGKSSLTLSLLRCIFTEGNVYYDGVNTSDLNLDVLRTNVTIIPQVPELLSGTLRENLDPFNEHDDAVLNSALRASGLFSLQSEADEGRITLDSRISSGGSNLSVGQRQILALARALVRGSKLLILDEATSSIDYETDTIIQSSLRNALGGDVTLLTIAHRLQTIMDADKIMVLDAGRIVELDSPAVLLKQDGGFFKSLVDESGDKDALYAMARK